MANVFLVGVFLIGVQHDVADGAITVARPQPFDDQSRLADATEPDYAQNALRAHGCLAQTVSQRWQAFVLHPRQAVVAVPRPVCPGTERAHRSWLGLLFHPDRDGRVRVCPFGNLVCVPKRDLAVIDGDASPSDRFADALLAAQYGLLGVAVTAQHSVAATGFQHIADLRLQPAALQDVPAGGPWLNFPGLQLELIDPARQEGGAFVAALPLDAPVLPAVGRVDIAGDMGAIPRQAVRTSFRVQQSTQQLGPTVCAEPSHILAANAKRRSPLRHRRHGQGLAGLQGSKRGGIVLQQAQERHDRGCRL